MNHKYFITFTAREIFFLLQKIRVACMKRM